MKIFRIQVLYDESHQLKDHFLLEIPFYNQRIELDGYWMFSFDNFTNNMLINALIFFLEDWRKAIINLQKYEKIFLSIGLWDECVEGFYIVLLNDYVIKVAYGSILNWGLYSKIPCLYDINETIFHKEFEIETTKEDFMQDISENIAYLEKEIDKIKR
jgi:hypothetical protein